MYNRNIGTFFTRDILHASGGGNSSRLFRACAIGAIGPLDIPGIYSYDTGMDSPANHYDLGVIHYDFLVPITPLRP